MSAEECLRHIEHPEAFDDSINSLYDYWHRPGTANNEHFLACKKLIADERRRRFVAKRKEVLRLRSLVVRGRAKKSSDAMLEPSFRLPDGVLWNVLSFWPPRCDYLYLPASLYRPAPTYGGHRPGFVFKTRDGHTGYWVDDGSHKTPVARRWTQHDASAQWTPGGLGPHLPQRDLDALTAFADRSGLSAIADPEARREAAAQKADEITALLSI